MAYKKNAHSFYAEVDNAINEVFSHQWRERNQQKNAAVNAAMNLWIQLPNDLQALLIAMPGYDTKHIAELCAIKLRNAMHESLAFAEQQEKQHQVNT